MSTARRMLRPLAEARARAVAWAARGLAWALAFLPPRAGLALGALAGRIALRLAPRRAEVGLINLRIAFPEWSESRRRRVLDRAFANLGRGVVEVAQMTRLSPEAIVARTEVEGLEHLGEARRRSPTGGVIVLTGHYGNWELMGAAMALRGLPISLVHRERENPHLEQIVRGWRERCGLRVLPRGQAARQVLRALHRGEIVALPLDQNAKRREGVFVPFFGRLACTRDGPARIAMRLGVPVIPVFVRRRGDDPTRHVVRIQPVLELVGVGGKDPEAIAENVRRMNLALERAIREAPDHWIWNHRRWKTQPLGDPRPYRPKREPGPIAALLLRRIGLAR